MTLDAAIAANRFGLGATPGQLSQIAGNPKSWLLGQLQRPALATIRAPRLLTSLQAVEAHREYLMDRRAQNEAQARQTATQTGADMSASMNNAAPNVDPAVVARLARGGAQAMAVEIEARAQQSLVTPAPFLERWTLMWSNALTVSARSLPTIYLAGPYEREAIRPNVLGKFSTLLKASALHPGMLVYLDQVRSIGPNAPAANTQRGRRRNLGLNENLAREILELHTLGSDGGYSQADVTEFARALTGWTLMTPQIDMGGRTNANLNNQRRNLNRPVANEAASATVFSPAMHEPGPRTIMGRTFAPTGQTQAIEILDFLAGQPQTANRIAKMVATHFVSDTPPASLVTRLERNFAATGGDLRALAETLITSPEPWTAPSGKLKSPQDFITSTMCAGGSKTASVQALRSTFEQLGQTPWRAPSPKGWPDTSEHWGAPDAILKRVDWSNLAADVIGESMSPMIFAENALGVTLTPATRTAITRAQDSRQAIVLALMSPEFQRR